jgi:acetyl/propionyl-CoA carboxylase alpha subunit
MLAKVIAHAPARAEAAHLLAKALAGMRVHGVRTNLRLLIGVLRHPEFLAGNLGTHFIATHLPPTRGRTPADDTVDGVHAVAVTLWQQEQRRRHAPVLRSIPSGWRNNPSQMQVHAFSSGEAAIRVEYSMRTGGHADVVVGGTRREVGILGCDDSSITMVLDDVRRTYRIVCQGDVAHVHSALGASELHAVPRFPPPVREEVRGGCHSPMPGRILSVRVNPGQAVQKGDLLVIVEAMKMEHEVVAPYEGTVQSVSVEEGQQVDAGAVLVTLEETTAVAG